VLKGTAAFAGLAAAQASGLASAAAATPADTSSGHPKANVLLVHGAWVDGSSWSQVIAILQQRGGAVISGAATGVENVIGLVFASAFAPDEGESLGELGNRFPPPPGLAHTQPDSLGFLWFDPAAVPTFFAQDIPVEQARVLGSVQKPIAARSFTDPAGPPAWTTLPSRWLAAKEVSHARDWSTTRRERHPRTPLRCNPTRCREAQWQASFNVAAGASPYASYACVDSWLTDFRGDLPKFDVPTLVVHGIEDRILPIGATAERLPGMIADLKPVKVEGGPHNIAWTHPDKVNKPLLEFLAD
jgi:pimeloyl-ACP methyl ester carboxylesterase